MAARDQAARIVQTEADDDNVERIHGAPTLASASPDDHSARRTDDTPATEAPANDTLAAAPEVAAAKPGKRKFVLMGVGALLALAAISYGTYYVLVGRFMIGTDDAYVRANNTTLGARVAGHLARIAVGDNVPVKAGQLLFKIDDGDYVLAVRTARNKIATQEATIARIGHQIEAQGSAVEQAKAQLVSAEAAVKRTEADFARQQTLSDKGFASKATFEVSLAGRDQAVASVQAAKAALASAQDNVGVIKAQQMEARGQLDELKTALAKAERDLAFTTVVAPVDGVFSNRMVNEGDYIQPGQRLANVVPLDDVYVDANFKETQLRRLKPGQPVDISVDANKDEKVEGIIASIAPASGSVFTLLPPDNATGNFTKIVQRVPVRIRIPADVAKQHLMRAGMSVYVTVDTRKNAPVKVADTH
ncbi:MAG: HlyD family secretion protein [Rhizobiales bacterium]|nr:HlyD family secretion protein [Hyphomicrobiales bacterium]